MDELATVLAQEHGKTFPDAKGDIQRGIEVVEFAAGAPHLLKGEFSSNAGSGIDVHSIRQPLGIAVGITPFNFPAMIPLWKAGIALAAIEDARIGDTHVSRVGLVAGDGGTVIWPLLIGINKAKEFLIRGTLLKGNEALFDGSRHYQAETSWKPERKMS